MATKKGMGVGKKVAIGAGLAAVGAAGYYFLGPKGKQHQAKAKAMVMKAEKKIESKVKQVKDIAMPLYQSAMAGKAKEAVKKTVKKAASKKMKKSVKK